MVKNVTSYFKACLPARVGSSDFSQSKSVEPTQREAAPPISSDKKVLANRAKRERGRLFLNMPGASRSAELQTRGSQSKCADIDHPQWDRISASLRKYVQARMQKALAQEQHFGAEHLAKQQGICRGMGAVWLRLHHAKPDAAASSRMDLLMSESGTAHATIAQRLYHSEDAYTWASQAPMDAMPIPEFDSEVANNISTMYATQTTWVNEGFLSEKEYHQLGELLSRSPGYYNMGLAFQKKNGERAGHDFSIFSAGHPHPLTIYDSNLGECQVPEKDFPRFMKEMSHFYEATRGCEITGIRSVLKMEFTDDISNTPLAELAAELR
jgi:hypothetical protein